MQDAKQLEEQYQNSVFQVYTHSKEYDYANPWLPPTQSASSGSGYVVQHDDKPYLLTNAHVVDGAGLLEIRLPDSPNRYTAHVKIVDHDCDIAMLEVDNPEFWGIAKALPLGKMPSMRQNLQIFGFPIGGGELCITDGAVSRIEVSSYVHSDVRLLQTQVSAAINPGNSGGPAISNGEVIGMAFQGSNAGEALGYIIPPPIIKHFLSDASLHDQYQGFPDIAMQYQSLGNARLRAHLTMEPEQTGIRIKQIDKTSSAYKILQPNDVLLALDDIPINNDGTVALDFSKRIHFSHLIKRKQIGESIKATLIRDGELINIDLPLQYRSYTTKYSQREFDKGPTYYIHGGLVFMPVTDNFIRRCWGSGLGKYLNKGKATPGQEIVLVNKVLAADSTRELLSHRGEIVITANGIAINNLRDLIQALESNSDSEHILKTKAGNLIVMSNAASVENQAILDAFDIPRDRSRDLLSEPKYAVGCPEYTRSFLPGFAASSSSLASIPVISRLDSSSESALKHVMPPPKHVM